MYPVETLSESSVTAIAPSVAGGKRVSIDGWQRRYPTHVRDVAQVIVQLSKRYVAWCVPLTAADVARLPPRGVVDPPQPTQTLVITTAPVRALHHPTIYKYFQGYYEYFHTQNMLMKHRISTFTERDSFAA
jgi:hypothetical protein